MSLKVTIRTERDTYSLETPVDLDKHSWLSLSDVAACLTRSLAQDVFKLEDLLEGRAKPIDLKGGPVNANNPPI